MDVNCLLYHTSRDCLPLSCHETVYDPRVNYGDIVGIS